MSNTIIYDFVSEFFPQHKPFWKNLSEEEMAFFNVIPYNENQLKRVLFDPEENIEKDDKTGTWVLYYAFELDFGRVDYAVDAVKVDSVVYPLTNAEELYDFLKIMNNMTA